jgi:hypothetical protein
MTASPFKFFYKHSSEDRFGGCDGKAFYLRSEVLDGETLSAKDVVWLDGTKPSDGDNAICGSCGKGMPELLAKNIIKE